MKFVDELDMTNKRVFLRADLNVPLGSEGKIADDFRIRATLPTIRSIVDRGGIVVLASHLGRPDGKVDPRYTLRPVADHLTRLLGKKVALAPDCVSEKTLELVKALRPGDVLLLENLRFYGGEEKNDPDFAKQLARLADVYVNDAFGTAHRKHASTYACVSLFKERAGGFTLKDELAFFNKALEHPKRPLVAIFGGAKISTKLAAIKNVAKKANKIIVGGGMANTFLAARGLNIGKSLCEKGQLENARDCEAIVKSIGCELLLPVDVVVAAELKGGVPTSITAVESIKAEQMALDIGPKSLKMFTAALVDAGTIVWNGPMGAFETPEFSAGTFGLIDALVQSKALTLVGGGDTDLALHMKEAFDKVSYVSTGGGAFIELLEGKALPAIDALK